MSNQPCLPPQRPHGEGQSLVFLVVFLSCDVALHPTHPPPEHFLAVQSWRSDEHLGKSLAGRTLGGLPLFLFSPTAGATSDVEAAMLAALLFLLPLGRPRPRFTGDSMSSGRGTRATVSTTTHLIDHRRARQVGEKGGGLTRV